MVKVLWVGDEGRVPDGLVSSGVSVTVAEDTDGAVEEAADSDFDCVVGDTSSAAEVSLFTGVREVLPDVSCVVYGDADLWDSEGDTTVVLDFVPEEAGGDLLAEHIRTTSEKRSQVSYPLRDDEEDRLVEVARFVDAPTDGMFDRLTRLARSYFDIDFAFVGLVEERRERFLSCHGADVGELDRENTVCTFQILDDGVSVFEDLHDDPRFESNERLRELGFRFYAGASLVSESGLPVGSFCVMDEEPREFTEEDRRALKEFAEEASEKLELLDRAPAVPEVEEVRADV